MFKEAPPLVNYKNYQRLSSFYGEIFADENSAGESVWTLSDNQGTVRDLVDSIGTIQNHITYDSYGQITNQSNTSVIRKFG